MCATFEDDLDSILFRCLLLVGLLVLHPVESRASGDRALGAVVAQLEAGAVRDGMYVETAGIGSFTVCGTDARMPVMREADAAALERGYAALRSQPDEPMLVTLEMRIVERQAGGGGVPGLSVVPLRFVGAWPRESCPVREAAASLQETYWRLTRLREAPVVVASQQREPHLVFRRDDGRLTGSGGCNRLVGSYALADDRLTVAGAGLTRMACPDGMEQEARVAGALGEVVRWRVQGRHLDLFDAGGVRILRFEAVALR